MHARARETLSEATLGVAPRAQRQLIATLEHIKHNLIAAESAAVCDRATQEQHRHGRPRAKPARARA